MTSALAAVTGYALRIGLPRRPLLLLLPPAVGLLFGFLARMSDLPTDEAYLGITVVGLLTVLLPLTCLVVADAVLGGELRSGAFALSWRTPVRRSVLVGGRWLGAVLVALAVLLPTAGLAAAAAGAAHRAGTTALAVAAGAAAYLAVFLAATAMLRRPVLWCLLLVALVEPVLGGLSTRVAQVSPSWLARAGYAGLSRAPAELARMGVPQGWAAVLRLLLVAGVGLCVAWYGLRRLRASASD